ncbi:hypothetical protein [Streptomyces rubradiris]|uniref:Uncharacterized protein n=1 Tax=Streptomyces rubradiris TaxID=285531 RepID=A0ABQ3RNJ9_STRRR|nr:hypothetical protein [Streptomyces rubradiris]GHH13113.1 hypothetical protein GCM10018792_39500 [Streptomyces rubradiris]GHI57423.1 hypothetical protein Srubr_72690 [Streptomyces rubradiris]
MRQRTYPGPPVDPPLDGWLYEARPKPGCTRCAELKAQLDRATRRGEANARFEAARSIRQCAHEAAE